MHRLMTPKVLLAWGANNFGQLGLGSEEPYHALPQVVDLREIDLSPSDIKGIYSGPNNTFMVLKNGIVYGAGLNNVAQLGSNPLIVNSFTRMDHLVEYCIRDMAVSLEAVYAITDKGTLIGWGSNSCGKLSLDPSKFLTCRIPVLMCEDVKAIAVGINFIIILNTDGQLLSCGDGRSGQLGRTSDEKIWEIKPLDFNLPVRSIVCGQLHCLLLTETNRLFTWGANNYGQLGIEHDKPFISTPTEITTLGVPLDKSVKIRCGWRHSAVFFGNGKIFQWGENNHGQCGGGSGLEFIPVQLNDLVVNKVSVGFAHTLVIIDKGIVLAWGENSQGSCGIGTTKNVIFPIKFRTGVRTAATRIFTGYKQSFALAL